MSLSAEKLMYKIWNSDRSKKKIIISEPKIQHVLDAGKYLFSF